MSVNSDFKGFYKSLVYIHCEEYSDGVLLSDENLALALSPEEEAIT